MIKLANGLCLTSDKKEYILGVSRPDKKTGEDVFIAQAYFTRLPPMLHWIKERMRREAVAEADGGFEEFYKAIRAADKKFADEVEVLFK